MLRLSIENNAGHSDVSVYTAMNATTNPWQDWLDPNLVRASRNVAAFPIRITNPDPVEYMGPSPTDNPEKFVTSPIGPVLKSTLRISVLNEDDSIVKEKLSNPPFLIVREGQVRIKPGESIYTNGSFGHSWFDKTGAIPVGRLLYLFIEFDPFGQITSPTSSAYCNVYGLAARFYTGQVRHGLEVDIP